MYQTDKCVVAQVLKVVVIINLIVIDHSRMIQAFRIIEISKYDDGGQLTTCGQLMQGSSICHRVTDPVFMLSVGYFINFKIKQFLHNIIQKQRHNC